MEVRRALVLAGVGLAALLTAAWLFGASTAPTDSGHEHVRVPVEPEQLEASKPPVPTVRSRGNPTTAPVPEAPQGDASPYRAAPPSAQATPDPGEDAVPEVVEGIEITVWPLDKDGIFGAVNEVLPAIQDCYNDALDEIPDLQGKLSVSFEVGEQEGMGKIVDAWIADDQLQDGPMSQCVEDAMRALQFDPPAGEGTMRINYPIVFRPE